MQITLKTTFELTDNVTLEAYNKTSDDHVGTLVIKDGKLIYHNLILHKEEDYDEDTLSEFENFVNEFQLEFKKSKDRKYINYQPNPKKNNTTDLAYQETEKVIENKNVEILVAKQEEETKLLEV